MSGVEVGWRHGKIKVCFETVLVPRRYMLWDATIGTKCAQRIVQAFFSLSVPKEEFIFEHSVFALRNCNSASC